MEKEVAVTIDIGTTNCKITVFDTENATQIIREKFLTPKYEDNYGDIFDEDEIILSLLRVISNLQETTSYRVDSIIISSVGEAGALVSEAEDKITPVIAWYDKRAADYIEKIDNETKKRISKITGLPVHSNYSLSKILWLIDYYGLKSSGERYTWLNLAELIAYKLTNNMKSEYSLASRTLCFDLQTKSVSKEILSIFDIETLVSFPELIYSNESIGKITRNKFNNMIDDTDIDVYVAGHDHMVGANAISLQENEMLNSTGTTEGLLMLENRFNYSEERFKQDLSLGVYPGSNQYTLFASIPSGGNAIDWIRTVFGLSWDEFNTIINKVYNKYKNNEIDIENHPFIIPHLKGSGAPTKTTSTKGLFYGITLETGVEEIILSLFLGLVLEMKLVVECFPHQFIKDLIVIGPATKNKLWLQLKADSINHLVKSVNIDETVSLGNIKLIYPNIKIEEKHTYIYPDYSKFLSIEKLFNKYTSFYDLKINNEQL